MFDTKTVSLEWGGKTLTLETGRIARQADGAVLATYGETVVLCAVTAAKSVREGQDFFPLTVHYQEKFSAAGRIPGGFFKREGRATEKETLTSRLIDRPVRPLFPEGFYNDLNGRGMKLMQGLNAAAEEAGIPILVQGVGSTFWTTFTERESIRDYREHASSVDEEKYALFAVQMLRHGVRLSTNARWHMSSAHNDADIDQTLEAARASLKAMAE